MDWCRRHRPQLVCRRLRGLVSTVWRRQLAPGLQLRRGPGTVRRQFGFVTQETQLFSGTLRANLTFVKPDATDAEMRAALEREAA